MPPLGVVLWVKIALGVFGTKAIATDREALLRPAPSKDELSVHQNR